MKLFILCHFNGEESLSESRSLFKLKFPWPNVLYIHIFFFRIQIDTVEWSKKFLTKLESIF